MRHHWWKALLLVALLLYPPLVSQAEWINGDLFVVGPIQWCSDVGSTDAYACTPTDTRTTTYITGARFSFRANTVNTGQASFNFNTLGVKIIKKWSGGAKVDLTTGDIQPGQMVDLLYDGTDMQMLSQLSNLPASLAANGANCAVAGTFPNGVDASGAAENCVTLSAVNPQTSTYQVLAADFDGYKTITVASGTFTITLVASGTQPAAGKYITVINYGSGVVTLARSGQNINGGTTSLNLPAASATAPTSAFVISDGANYFAALGGAAGGGADLTSAQTFTNKRITPRVLPLTDAATVTPNADTTDMGILTTLSQATLFANPSGTPTDGQRLTIRIKSTIARALTYGSEYRGGTMPCPTTTSGGSLTDYIGLIRNGADTKWDCVSFASGY